MRRRASVQLAFVALFALVLAPALCDAQAVRRASPEEPSGRKRDRPSGPSNHKAQRPTNKPGHEPNGEKYEHDNKPKHEHDGEVCVPETTCYADHECAAEFPCTKTECVFDGPHLFGRGNKNDGAGVCVCFENKPVDTPCIGDEDVCKGPLGKCDAAGVCVPQPDDDGCPCADNECTVPDDACVDPDLKCICKSGECVVNYLPEGISCDPGETAVTPCQEAKCVKQATLVGGNFEVVCKVVDKPEDTPCIGDENVCKGPLGKCDAAGVCVPQPDDDGCPCADDQCTKPDDACVDPDLKCICESGECVVNYLPEGISCVPAFDLKQCEEATCVKQETFGGNFEVLCEVENRPDNTACSGDEVGAEPTCDNAGKCVQGKCDNLQCQNIPPPPPPSPPPSPSPPPPPLPDDSCEARYPGQDVGCTTRDCGSGNSRCAQACSDATAGQAACIYDGNGGLSCICNSPGGGQDQFDCVKADNYPPLGSGRARCCVCATPEPRSEPR